MRIGIDATFAAQRRIVGISRFAVQLVRQLAESDAPNRYDLFYRPRALRHPNRFWHPRDPRFRSRLLLFPLTLASFRDLDVYHSTYQWLPRHTGRTPLVGTLHDVFYLSRPDLGSHRTRQRAQARYRDVALRARLIVTLSEYSKAEIGRRLQVDPGRIRVVPLAADTSYSPQPEEAVARVRRRYGLASPYILFAGGFGRRKNATGAVRAFADALPHLPRDVALVLSGAGGPLENEVGDLLHRPELRARVHLLGFVPDADYPALMSGCHLFFLPTLLEGFGLPALEAMACAAPVLTASTTCLPEVCGDAACLVDPEDGAALAGALVELCGDAERRDRLSRRGPERARQFSWQRVAQEMLRIYAEVAARRA
jgi:glycosyltransferase involved in cell wall biosynthesis